MAWIVCGDGTLRSFALDGTPRERTRASATAVAGTAQVLVTLDGDGRLVRRDPQTGRARQDGQRDGSRQLLSDDRQVWAIDADGQAEVVWPATGSSGTHLGADVARVTAADGQLWWTTTSGDLRTQHGSRLALRDLDTPTESPLAICAGSVWVGQDRGLLRVGVRRLDRGIDVPTGRGRPAVLACAGGRIVGATPTAVLVLDPRIDEEMTVLDTDVGGTPITAFGDQNHAWIVSTGGALVVTR